MKLTFFASAALFLAANAWAADAPELKVTHPKHGEITRFVTLPGTVKANQQATLYAKVPGYLKSLVVDKGDTVKEDQALGEKLNGRIAEAEKRIAGQRDTVMAGLEQMAGEIAQSAYAKLAGQPADGAALGAKVAGAVKGTSR